jgi:acyl-CoA synthetase (AMP-forming)/AMP-acid ligase II
LQEDQVGEIWIKSDSKAAGYYRKDAETLKDFGAMMTVNGKVPKSNLNDGYLRSGDLGFMHKDELFICGRIKDLIIVGGRNYYPQDLEATAESCDERIRPGCVAAFTVDPISGHDEEVALLLELREVPDAKVRITVSNALKLIFIFVKSKLSLTHLIFSSFYTYLGA